MRIHKRKPTRLPDYLIWLTQQPCMICAYPYSDAHHAKGLKNQGGVSMKATDLCAFPLCREHHDEYHRMGVDSWQEKYGDQEKLYYGPMVLRAIREGVI